MSSGQEQQDDGLLAHIKDIERNSPALIPLTPEQRLDKAVDELRIRRAAQKFLLEEEAERLFTLPLLLDREQIREAAKDAPKYRIDGLMLAESDFVLIGEKKAGKSTILLNMIQSLLTGEPFLGEYDARPVDGNILYLNYELSLRMLDDWVDRIGIDDRRFKTLQVRRNSNPLRSDYGREYLAKVCEKNEVEVLIVDPFGPAYSGSGDENSNSQQREWLEQLGEVAGRAGVKENVLSVHSGKDPSKEARGGGAILDWAASYAQVFRYEDLRRPREFKAEGRDVYLKRFKLAFDEETHRISRLEEQVTGFGMETIDTSTAKGKRIIALGEKIVEVVNEKGTWINQTDIRKMFEQRDITYGGTDFTDAFKAVVDNKLVAYKKSGTSKYLGPDSFGVESEPAKPAGPTFDPDRM